MRRLSGAAAVFALLLAVPLRGQAGPGGIGMGSADRLLWLSEELGFTDEQVESLRSIEEDARAAQDDARLAMRAMRDQLRDGEITRGQFLDLSTARREAMIAQQEALRERIDGVLTDEQRAQLRPLRGRGVPGRGMMRRGRGPAQNRGFRRGGRRGGFGPGYDAWGGWGLNSDRLLRLRFGWDLGPQLFR